LSVLPKTSHVQVKENSRITFYGSGDSDSFQSWQASPLSSIQDTLDTQLTHYCATTYFGGNSCQELQLTP